MEGAAGDENGWVAWCLLQHGGNGAGWVAHLHRCEVCILSEPEVRVDSGRGSWGRCGPLAAVSVTQEQHSHTWRVYRRSEEPFGHGRQRVMVILLLSTRAFCSPLVGTADCLPCHGVSISPDTASSWPCDWLWN